MSNRVHRSVLPALVILAAGYLLGAGWSSALALPAQTRTGLRGAAAPGATAMVAFGQPAPSTPAAKLHPALLRRLAEEGAPVKTWVFFADKGMQSAAELDAALQEVGATYNPRAAHRRALRGSPEKQAGHLFDDYDLPVPPAYLDAVKATGARGHVVSRWLNAVSVYATRAQLDQLATLPFVARLEAVGRSRHVAPVDVRPLDAGAPGGGRLGPRLDYGYATDQLNQIHLIALHDAGFTAQGVIIGILDTGFHREHVAFNNPDHPLQVVAEHDFINNDDNTDIEPDDYPDQHAHGTMILGALGAYQPGSLVGGAYDAAFILCKTEDITGEYPAEEDNYVGGLEFIEANGGDMTTSSLGYIDWYTQDQLDGQTAVTTIGINIATANGLYCCTAAGNQGHDEDPATSHLLAPADAFQVISCGAADSGGTIAGFSSDGPTADGRVKPELLARGVDTATVWPYGSDGYVGASGTSLSTPLVASAVACIVQASPQWSVDALRTAMFHAADYYVAYGTYDPLSVLGYGMVNAYASLPDCNGNTAPDVVDIANGTSQDCNGNGIPDECDIAGGTSTDVNGNGIPDECEGLGDLNCDGALNAFDIDPFVLALTSTPPDYLEYYAAYPNCDRNRADCNGDGAVNAFDIDPFVDLLTGG